MSARGGGPEPLFREVQRFASNRFAAGTVLLGAAVLAYSALLLVASGQPASGAAAASLAVLLVVFLAYPYLETEVRPSELRVRFPPWRGRRLTAADVEGFEAVTYRPLAEFGGWGYRVARGRRAYNVAGNRGVAFALRDGTRLVVGSQRPDELDGALRASFGSG